MRCSTSVTIWTPIADVNAHDHRAQPRGADPVRRRRMGHLPRDEAAARPHPGGSSSELLTVYSIVNALTSNLPTITRVQILVDGKEVDSLAGHVDLRRPLEADLTLVRKP